jgi:3-oxoacyl-[acyl-carrier-protein] synthase III
MPLNDKTTMIQKVKNVKIIGTGSFVPETIYTNEYLETLVDTKADWIYKTLGIKERHIAFDTEATSDLAAKAALQAIESSNISVDDVDLIIVATTTPDRQAPSTACIVQEKIKAFNSSAFDLAAVCSGFLYAGVVATQFVSAGTYKNVLVIGADTFSKITDWTRRDCVFFGDGAGAAIFSVASHNEGFISTKLHADGRGKYAWTIPAGGSEKRTTQETIDRGEHFFIMDGKAVYDTATTVLPKVIRAVLAESNLTLDDVKYIIPHQPSIGVLKETAKRLGVSFDKFLTNMDKYANTSAATIPLLLDETNKAGRLLPGDNILFAAVGAGWTWGATVMTWA